jgi:hypothetical protein
MGSKQFRLEANAIAIAAAQLQHWLQAALLQQFAKGKAAHAHHRSAAIGNVECLHQPPQTLGCRQCPTGISP